MIKHRYLFAALATLAVATTAQAARYWLASDVVKNTTPGNAQGYANTLTLTSDDPSDPVDPIVVTDVRQIDTAGTSRQLRKLGRDNGTPPFAGCPYGGAKLDFTLPIRDADGNAFTLVELNSECFNGNNYVGAVKLPSTITAIGDRAFQNCDYLRDFSFAEDSSSLESIGVQLFRYCDRLQFVEWPAGFATLPNATFAESKLIGFYGPSVKTVEAYAFQKCPDLKAVEFGAAPTFAGSVVFQNVNAARKQLFFRAGPPTVNKYFTGNGEVNAVFDWLTLSQGVDFYIPLNATGDGPTAEWATFKTDFEADDAGNAVTWPTPNGDGTWTAGSIYSARHKRSAGLYYWDTATTTTSALLAY